jgi:hypothetical protein
MIFTLPKNFAKLRANGAAAALIGWAAAVAAVGIFGGSQGQMALAVLMPVGIWIVAAMLKQPEKNQQHPPSS